MFDKFQELEKKYDVQNISVRGIQMWPVLRIYLASQIVFEQDRSVKVNASILRSGLKYLFLGLSNIFKKTDYLFLSSSDQRKKIGDKFIDRADIVSEMLENTLIVELPSNSKHYKKKERPDNRLMSKFIFYAFVTVISKITFGVKIKGEEVLKEIMKECDLEIDYKSRIRIFLAERRLMRFLIKWKKLKGLLLITPYTNMGYVYAFKEMTLPVIEFQHGTISSSHYAYNINKEYDQKLSPSQLLTFGRREVKVFDEANYYIKKDKVRPVGSFIIDSIMKEKPMDERFSELTKNYEKTVAFTAQDALEKQFIPFLKSTAELNLNIAYILIPRFKDEAYYSKFNFPSNVLYMPWLSTYELMYMCDVHATINSTTALEAPSLGTMNILANVENRAEDYFKGFIDDTVCKFASDPEEFLSILDSLTAMTKEEIASLNKDLIETNFKQNIRPIFEQNAL